MCLKESTLKIQATPLDLLWGEKKKKNRKKKVKNTDRKVDSVYYANCFGCSANPIA